MVGQQGGLRAIFRGLHAALAVGLLALAGCGGDELPRQAVSGSVEFDNKPLAVGQIEFYPRDTGPYAVAGGSPISAGRYSIPQAEGLTPGTYKVVISAEGESSATKGRQKKVAEVEAEVSGEMPGLGDLNVRELIPARYNAQSELTAKVTEEGPNQFDFKLTK
jgi:hypothetical protein